MTATATAATLSTLGAIGAGAAIGAAAAAASQLVGVATGLQNKFSFKGVALVALSGGVGGGVSRVNLFGQARSLARTASDVARGALGNAAVQGVGVVSGLQRRFDFAGVTVGGVVAGVGGAFDRRFVVTGAATGVDPRSVAGYAEQTLAGAAAALAGAGARSLITGSSFGDNILAALPDVIGQTVGSVAANAATPPPSRINATTENATLRDGFAAATTSTQLSGLVVSVANLSLPSALRLVQFIDQPEESLFERGVAAITDVTGAIADRARVLADTLIGVVRDPEAALDEIVVTARRSATTLLDRGGSYLNSLRDISITNAINTINGLGRASREGVRFGSAARGAVITTRGVSLGGAQSGLVVTRQGEVSLRGDRGGLVVTNQGVSLGGLIATRAGVSLGGAEGLVIARNGVCVMGIDLIRTGPGPIATGSIGTIPRLIPTQVVPALNGGVRGVGGANTLSTLQLTPPELAQVTINQKAGRARERLVAAELRAQFPNASVQSERLLRDADGNKLIDKFSKEGRRIDLAVIENGKVLKLVEVTSLTADKRSQARKELNIRKQNDVFIRDRITREIINVNNVKTETDRRD